MAITIVSTLLRVETLNKHYGGVHAVADVSFSVQRGERVALIGPNGAGKTTCFNMIGGQVRPDSGRVLLSDQDITGSTPRQLFHWRVGRTFQITESFGSMSVIENVELALASRAYGTRQVLSSLAGRYRNQAMALLDQVGLRDHANDNAAYLAYGDIKQLDLGLALANDPQLLLMDEPTAGMATSERHALMNRVSSAARARDLGVLFTEHDMDVVFGHADRILVMDHGRLIADDTPQSVRASAEVQRIYLGEQRQC